MELHHCAELKNTYVIPARLLRSTFRPRIFDNSSCNPKNPNPGVAPGSNSTSTSMSLSGRKSSRRIEPKSDSFRMRWLRQKSAIRCVGMCIPLWVMIVLACRLDFSVHRSCPSTSPAPHILPYLDQALRVLGQSSRPSTTPCGLLSKARPPEHLTGHKIEGCEAFRDLLECRHLLQGGVIEYPGTKGRSKEPRRTG